jgi:hypothetical protein
MGVFSQVAKLVDDGAKRIKAYHGSPHDFDKFSTENIGTGEGAQAYGHGLYFAEREGTAQSYRDQLKANRIIRDDGVEMAYGKHLDEVQTAIKKQFPNINPDNLRSTAKSVVDDNLVPADVEGMGVFDSTGYKAEDIYLSGIKANKSARESKGHMYEVDIDASPDELLDFDAPLSEQSDYVKSKLPQEVFDYFKNTNDPRGINLVNDNPLVPNRAMIREPEYAAQAAAKLNDLGIKGIKYTDAQTRFSGGDKTQNFVIFDDKTVEIARKYGVSMPVAGAILAGSLAPENAEAGVVSEGVHLAQRVLELGILKAQSAGNPTSVKTAITKYNKFMKESPAFADRERRAYAEDFKTIFNEADIAPKQIITPESLVGNTITPVRGDRSNIGQLSQVGGIPVDVPVEGGVKFSRQHGGWASSEGIARGQHNKHIAAANDTENDVYGVYNAMGVDSVNFSTPIAEGMMQQIPALNRLAKTDIKVFDKDLRNIKKVVTKKDGSRKVSYPYKDWVGLDHPDAMDQLMGQNGYPSVGALRTAFSTTMGKAAYRDKGFPTYGELVKAVEDKDLSNLNLGDAGHSFYKVDTSQGVQPFSQHKSYDTLMPGEYAGGLEQSIPFDVMFPKSFDRYTNSGKFLPRNQAIDAANKRKDGYEVADQQWLDGVKGFIERNKKLAAAGGVLASGGANANVPSAQSEDGLLKDTGDVLGEIMAGANRGVVDALNFFTVDQINAISQLMGSDKRVPTLYDVPLIEEATSGNFMDKGALRQAVRQGSEFLSPI